MAITTTFSCGKCYQPFIASGSHRPMTFECGHGSCQDCLSKMIALAKESSGNTSCYQCQAQIQAPSPNHDLIMRLETVSQKMVKQLATAGIDEFKITYNGLSSEGVKSFDTTVWITSDHQTTESSKDPTPKLLIKKTEVKSEEEKTLQSAAEISAFALRLKSLGDRISRFADERIIDLDKENKSRDDLGFKEKKKQLLGEVAGFSHDTQQTIARLRSYIDPEASIVLSKKEDKTSIERNEAALLKGLAYVMQLLAKKDYLAAGNAEIRTQTEKMLQVIFQIDSTLTKNDFIREYQALGDAAKKALTEAIGYAIGKPADGANYILGELQVDGKIITPNLGTCCGSLLFVVSYTGGKVPAHATNN